MQRGSRQLYSARWQSPCLADATPTGTPAPGADWLGCLTLRKTAAHLWSSGRSQASTDDRHREAYRERSRIGEGGLEAAMPVTKQVRSSVAKSVRATGHRSRQLLNVAEWNTAGQPATWDQPVATYWPTLDRQLGSSSRRAPSPAQSRTRASPRRHLRCCHTRLPFFSSLAQDQRQRRANA